MSPLCNCTINEQLFMQYHFSLVLINDQQFCRKAYVFFRENVRHRRADRIFLEIHYYEIYYYFLIIMNFNVS